MSVWPTSLASRQLKFMGASVPSLRDIWKALKLFGRNKSLGLDGLTYERYLSPVFVLSLALIYNYWMKLAVYPSTLH